jgi:very-short-patch-repair endonuclease
MNRETQDKWNKLKIIPKKKILTVSNDKKLENPFALWLSFKNIKYVRQYQPFKDRRYRCDFYLPDYNCIIEIEGGQWSNGRHQRGYGFQADMEKYNLLTLAGYRLIRLCTSHFFRVSQTDYAVNGYSAKILEEIDSKWGEKKNIV